MFKVPPPKQTKLPPVPQHKKVYANQSELFVTNIAPVTHESVANRMPKLPPPRVAVVAADAPKPLAKSLFVHYAFENIGKRPPEPKRKRPEPLPYDETLFMNGTVRPYPEWPLICREANTTSFVDEKSLRSWYATTSASIYRTWHCDFCKHFHAECSPGEVSGTSSGKANRKWEFLRKKGIEPDY